jgi:hypothetical protein
VPPLPLQRQRRRSQPVRCVSHNERRLMQHEGGYVDPRRLEFACLSIGVTVGPWAGVFGTPLAILHPMFAPSARILKFLRQSRIGWPHPGASGIGVTPDMLVAAPARRVLTQFGHWSLGGVGLCGYLCPFRDYSAPSGGAGWQG